MKNKKIMYVLMPLVIGLWGLITYRIYDYVKAPNTHYNITIPVLLPHTSSTFADTFSIHANYRDPFLDKPVQEVSRPAIKRNSPSPPSPSPPPAPWPQVSFGGIVSNSKNKQVVILIINGAERLVRTGDITDGITIEKIYRDSVEIAFQKEKRVVKK